MPLLSEIMQEGRPRRRRTGPGRARSSRPDTWNLAGARLADRHLTLLGLWADGSAVHMALMDEAPLAIAVVTLAMPGRTLPLGRRAASAGDPARARDARSLRARARRPAGCAALARSRRWDVQHPLGAEPNALPDAAPYAFLPVEGESLHQIPVGPVHAGIIEPGHFRFTANGETVVRLEQRLGYVHKGIEVPDGGRRPRARRRGSPRRTSGDSTVAYALAFAHAVEAALGIAVPPRARSGCAP